jgi:hypothetical protein
VASASPSVATASLPAGARSSASEDALGTAARIDRLEAEVRLLREELDSLKKQLGV